MTSSATGICFPQNPKKRVFPESSSRLESKGDVALLPSDEAVNRKLKKLKQNERADSYMKRKSSMMVPDESTKHPKTSSDSSLRLPNTAPKVKCVKKPVKAQDNNVPSRSKNFGKNDAIFLKYRNFDRYGTAKDYSDHRSREVKPPQLTNEWMKWINKEWKILETGLPDTIYVRIYEDRMDLLRAVIKGADGTPYHDGLFVFDFRFPEDYPHKPPIVIYHSGGLSINPNLYENGTVCLSLLNTWFGASYQRWTPMKSTILQVLVSIQAMILNENPFYNEPGTGILPGFFFGEKPLKYNERTLISSLKTMVYTMNKPPKNFEDLVIGHFHDRARGILKTCQAYMEGMKVGSNINEGKKMMGSDEFKKDVKGYMKTLVKAFQKIGVEDVEEFVPPIQLVPPTQLVPTQEQSHKSITQKIMAFFGI